MAHLSVTDTEGGQFITAERFSREALGLAGSRPQPFRVWLEDWSASGEGTGIPPMNLRAGTDRAGLQLTLTGDKPAALHGDHGMDPKGPERGNASHYYSLTRLEALGALRLADVEFDVNGTAWMDREWGTSALSPGFGGLGLVWPSARERSGDHVLPATDSGWRIQPIQRRVAHRARRHAPCAGVGRRHLDAAGILDQSGYRFALSGKLATRPARRRNDVTATAPASAARTEPERAVLGGRGAGDRQ